MSGSTILILIALGAVLVVGAFFWLNRNKPELLDKAEDKIRSYKK